MNYEFERLLVKRELVTNAVVKLFIQDPVILFPNFPIYRFYEFFDYSVSF